MRRKVKASAWEGMHDNDGDSTSGGEVDPWAQPSLRLPMGLPVLKTALTSSMRQSVGKSRSMSRMAAAGKATWRVHGAVLQPDSLIGAQNDTVTKIGAARRVRSQPIGESKIDRDGSDMHTRSLSETESSEWSDGLSDAEVESTRTSVDTPVTPSFTAMGRKTASSQRTQLEEVYVPSWQEQQHRQHRGVAIGEARESEIMNMPHQPDSALERRNARQSRVRAAMHERRMDVASAVQPGYSMFERAARALGRTRGTTNDDVSVINDHEADDVDEDFTEATLQSPTSHFQQENEHDMGYAPRDSPVAIITNKHGRDGAAHEKRRRRHDHHNRHDHDDHAIKPVHNRSPFDKRDTTRQLQQQIHALNLFQSGGEGGQRHAVISDGSQSGQRSAYFCSYGLLVADLVGDTRVVVATRCSARFLLGNVLAFLQVVLLAAVAGIWNGTQSSLAQQVMLLCFKALYLQYVLAGRPFVLMRVWLLELATCAVELVLLTLIVLVQVGVVMSPMPATSCIVLALGLVFVVVVTEAVRAVMVCHNFWLRLKLQVAMEKLPGGKYAGSRSNVD